MDLYSVKAYLKQEKMLPSLSPLNHFLARLTEDVDGFKAKDGAIHIYLPNPSSLHHYLKR